MPKNKFQDVVFTIIMATIMVYGMVVYNVALNTGTVNGTTFLAATHELPIMVPIAFVLEFFVVGKIAKMLAFRIILITKGLSLDSPLKKSIIYNITFSNKNTITGMVTIALSVVITFMALAYFESLPYT